MNATEERTAEKSGVALILVIGLLALMMVMAVAFAIYMRTERVAAGNFRNDVRVRQLLQVALARALNDVDSNMGNTPYPNWNILSSGAGGGAPEPRWRPGGRTRL